MYILHPDSWTTLTFQKSSIPTVCTHLIIVKQRSERPLFIIRLYNINLNNKLQVYKSNNKWVDYVLMLAQLVAAAVKIVAVSCQHWQQSWPHNQLTTLPKRIANRNMVCFF